MVLQTFADAGADPSIRYWYKPHIGTDVLRAVVSNIRCLLYTSLREQRSFRRSQYLYQSGEGDEAGGEAWFPHGDEAGLHL